ncbi:conjugative transposon protein TraM [Mucilaginibacter sp. HD30]
MQINFKQPKYVLPLLALPFLCLFFYVWHSGFSKPVQEVKADTGLNGTVGNVSAGVRKKELDDKLDAYRNTYKQADGSSAVNIIPMETSAVEDSRNADKDRKNLEAIDRAMRAQFSETPVSGKDKKIADALNRMPLPQRETAQLPNSQEKDPMEVFKQQMAYMDSVSKSNDPEYKAEQQKLLAAEQAAQKKAGTRKVSVTKEPLTDSNFTTVMPQKTDQFIAAVIDETITGYAGSRLRLKLLEDIRAGTRIVPKGTYLFAQISGFSEQRVMLSVTSILSAGMILPVKLDIYDLDGMPGLFVPFSSFREFTKDLGSNSVQGVTIGGNSGGSQFIMSSVDKLFQSTSSAIAGIIRKNKAKMKYNSYLYLIDTDALQNTGSAAQHQ